MIGPLFDWGNALRAEKARRAKLRRRSAALGVFAGLTLSPVLFPPPPRLLWNASPSAPIGLYSVSPGTLADPGDMVIARVPQPWRNLAARRHYLPANVPLVKRVAAAAGDEICALGRQIFINGRWITHRRATDARGRPMLMWTGCIRLHGRQLFLLMDNAASFDGRYFGPTEGKDIIGKARLLWRR